jgi:hypothetical protein
MHIGRLIAQAAIDPSRSGSDMKPQRAILPLLLLLTLTSPCLADDASRLAALLRTTGETSDTLGFLRGLRELGNVDLNQSEINRAMSQLRGTVRGPMAELMNPTQALRIRNGKVEIRRSRETLLAMGEGALKLGRSVSFKLSRDGRDTVMTSVRGLDVGENRNDLYDLKKVVFTQENGHQVAKVTAGVAFFTKTVTVRLPDPVTPPAPEVVASSSSEAGGDAPAAAPPCRGLIDILGGETAAAEPKVGDRGDHILDLQRRINDHRLRLGLDQIDEDGIFGRGSAAAYAQFREEVCD